MIPRAGGIIEMNMRSLSLKSVDAQLLHPSSTGIRNIPSLDGIRGLAIVMVVYCHFFAYAGDGGHGFPIAIGGLDLEPYLMAGSDGVRLFFVLSGLLLSLPFHERREGLSLKRFYTRRAFRIFPAYLVALASYAILVLLFGLLPHASPFSLRNILANATFSQPLFFGAPGITPDLIPGTWTLVAEVYFYLALPFVVRLFFTMRRALLTTAALLAACHAYRVAMTPLWESGQASFFSMTNVILGRVDLFAFGMLAGFLYHRQAGGKIWFRSWMTYPTILLGIGLYLWRFHGAMRFIPNAETIANISCFLLVVGVIMGKSVVRSIFEWSAIRFIGIVSYSMFLLNIIVAWYLIHPALNAFGVVNPLLRFGISIAAGVPALLGLSTIGYRFVERPLLVRRSWQSTTAPSGTRRGA